MAGLKITILASDVDLDYLTIDQLGHIARLRVEEAISSHLLFGLTGATAKRISVSVEAEEATCSPTSTNSP